MKKNQTFFCCHKMTFWSILENVYLKIKIIFLTFFLFSYLAPHLSTLPLDATIFESSSSNKSTDNVNCSSVFPSDPNESSSASKLNGCG